MLHRRLLAISFVAVLCLTGCAPSSPGTGGPAASSTSPPSSATPPSPVSDAALVVTLDGLEVQRTDGADVVGYADTADLVALIEGLVGAAPEVSRDDRHEVDFYNWPGVTVIGSVAGPASVAFTASELGGLPITTVEGLAVGSTREEALSAGAWNGGWDADGDGTPEFLGIGSREVPGTESMTHPGSVGTQFVFLLMDGDLVEQIQAPSNDFSDL
ncbi:hypothetical protein [Microbacterium sp. cf046]|uniref:hypothetical protein n=1 Tax=Microbacterium sp. cf046 TaxID=1761803 RepID=UPI0011143632|nr:hypothetical protein [Microbacterium sp. cf046]